MHIHGPTRPKSCDPAQSLVHNDCYVKGSVAANTSGTHDFDSIRATLCQRLSTDWFPC